VCLFNVIMFIYTLTRTHTHTHTHTYIYIYMYLCMYVCVYVYIFIYIHKYMYINNYFKNSSIRYVRNTVGKAGFYKLIVSCNSEVFQNFIMYIRLATPSPVEGKTIYKRTFCCHEFLRLILNEKAKIL